MFCCVLRSIDWPSWTSALAAVAGVWAAIVGICSARRASKTQAHLQQRQLKQDLFDKRYRLYDAVVNFVALARRTRGDFADSEILALQVSAGQAPFLFRNDVVATVNNITYQAIGLQLKCRLISQEEGKVPPFRNEQKIESLNQDMIQILKDLDGILQTAGPVFRSDLRIVERTKPAKSTLARCLLHPRVCFRNIRRVVRIRLRRT